MGVDKKRLKRKTRASVGRVLNHRLGEDSRIHHPKHKTKRWYGGGPSGNT